MNKANETEILMEEQERLSWLLAGVSTAVLGYLKPHESYAGQPIQQIEEAILLRASFEEACEALKPFMSVAAGKALSTNDLMCDFMRRAEKNIARIRSIVVPAGRARM